MIVTLEEFAEFIQHPTVKADERDRLQLHLDAAELAVIARCGPVAAGEQVMRVRASGRNLVVPATNLASVASILDPHGQAVPVDLQRSNLLAGVLTVPLRGDGWWTVTATVEGSDTPADVKLATLVIASHLWETQRGRGARPNLFNGSEDPSAGTPRGFALPARALELLRPYEMPTIA
ncbi:hypothetical protein ACFFKU_06875 [Kineococcus gynurae]|uniref:Uncharacterized protein n=1 Tax=Kineococcus gynurae TaxID=452979 RepID=A0ABV5LX15_9ACTN